MKNSACAFTSHRPHKFLWKGDETDPRCIALKAALTEQVGKLVDAGVTDFYSGMADGSDCWLSQIVLTLRNEKPMLKLHCFLPCEGQSDKWSSSAQERYHSILGQADSVVYVSHKYYDGCMIDRNHRLVEAAGLLLAVYNGERCGGTASTVRYAQKLGREIYIVDPISLVLRRIKRDLKIELDVPTLCKNKKTLVKEGPPPVSIDTIKRIMLDCVPPENERNGQCMKTCPYCGGDIFSERSNFCSYCGNQIRTLSPEDAALIPPEAQRQIPMPIIMCGTHYSPEEQIEIENVIEVFRPYITNDSRIDVIFSPKFGYLVLVSAEGEEDRIVKIDTHDELIWRLFWELSLSVRALELDGIQMLPNLYPNEVKEIRRQVADLLERYDQNKELKVEIQGLLESFLTAYPHGIFV